MAIGFVPNFRRVPPKGAVEIAWPPVEQYRIAAQPAFAAISA